MRARVKLIQEKDVIKAVDAEWNAKVDKVYETVKQDVAAQIMAGVLMYLNKRYGWKGQVLNNVKTGTEEMFKLMESGVLGKKFTTVDCIEYLQKLGVDIK